MVFSAEEMAREVRVAIDMNRTDEALSGLGDEETLQLDEVIGSKLCDAVRLVVSEAPARLLESGHDFGERDAFIGDDGKGFVILPRDFLRLVSFRMSDWRRTVFEAIKDRDPEYARQSSRWKGVCGNPERPVVAVVRRNEGLVLEFYSCADAEATVTQATYIPEPRIDAGGGIDIPRLCYRAAVYRAAALTLAGFGDQLATTMLEMSKSFIQ